MLVPKIVWCSNSFWTIQSSPTTKNLKTIYFVNSSVGWITGDSGYIAKTTNSGSVWSIQHTNTHSNIKSSFFINERLGWALAWELSNSKFFGTRIFRTSNGGDNWNSFNYPEENIFMKSIYFLDSLKGFMAGESSIFYTSNSGMNWEKTDVDTTLAIGFPIENVKFFNTQVGYACGGFTDFAGVMWKSINGGLKWIGKVVGPEPIYDLHIFNSSTVIASGGDYEYGANIVKTSNQGLTWNYDPLGTFGVPTSIKFRTSYEGWISLGFARTFSYTIDTGRTWRTVYTPDSVHINNIYFLDSLHGWSVGRDGAILKYNLDNIGIYNNIDIHYPGLFKLFQNYPNPFNPKTIINYDIVTLNYISLMIYDINGKEIAELANGNKPAGTYSVNFDGSDLPSGVYFYELKTKHHKEIKKMLLLK